jgi:hypothetical protein
MGDRTKIRNDLIWGRRKSMRGAMTVGKTPLAVGGHSSVTLHISNLYPNIQRRRKSKSKVEYENSLDTTLKTTCKKDIARESSQKT